MSSARSHFFWAFLIARTKFPAIAGEHENANEDHGRFIELLHYPHFLLAIVAQFLYVGAQVGTWSYFIQYIESSTREPEKVAGYLLTGTLVAFGVGRFASSALMRYVQPHLLMGVYGLINIALLAIGIRFPGWAGLWAIFATSFFMSVMYPTIFALGIRGLGRNTKIGGSLIVMGIVGGAVLTPAMGLISEWSHSIALAYIVPLACLRRGCAVFLLRNRIISRNDGSPGASDIAVIAHLSRCGQCHNNFAVRMKEKDR